MPIRIGFVLHVMQVAGAEVLVAEAIRRLGARLAPVVFCLDGVGELGQIMQREGVEVIAFGRRAGLDLGVARRMAREIRGRRLEVLHAHQYTPFFYGSIAARLALSGTRTILTEHGRHYPDIVSAKRRLANRWLFDRLADRITAVSAFSAEGLSRHDGFRAGRIEVIPNGIDVERYAPRGDRAALRARFGLAPGRRHIAMIARFHQVKDHRTLLRAFAEVAPAVDDVDLLLVGDGPLRQDLEQFVGERRLEGRVRFLGVRHDVPDILAAVDVFALSSLSEAASITLLEAMAAGRPVVVTAVGGNPEIVRDGVEGFLTPRGDAPAMAAALRRLLDDPALAETMGGQATDRVRTLYRLDATLERYYCLYRELSRPGR